MAKYIMIVLDAGAARPRWYWGCASLMLRILADAAHPR